MVLNCVIDLTKFRVKYDVVQIIFYHPSYKFYNI